MEELFRQIDNLGDSTPFAVVVIVFALLLTYEVIKKARKPPK